MEEEPSVAKYMNKIGILIIESIVIMLFIQRTTNVQQAWTDDGLGGWMYGYAAA